MADHDKIKERIRRMLALAEDPRNTDGERENALARATALMAEHQIEFITDAGRVKADKIGSREFTHEGSYTAQQANLLGWVAMAYGMRAMHWYRGQTYFRTVVYGYESDLEMLDMLYTSLLLQQATAFSKVKAPVWLYKQEVTAWRRDWLTSYASAVSSRIRQAQALRVAQHDREHAGDGTTGAALAVVDRKNAVDAHVAEMHPRVKKARPGRKIVNDDAKISGRWAGNQADIGLTQVGNRRRQVTGGH